MSGRRSDLLRGLAQRDQDTADHWAEAMRAHVMAPPDDDFAERLAETARAAADRAQTLELAAEQGLSWPAKPANVPLPYELRPGTGRRGPEEMWRRFDQEADKLERALGQTDLRAVALAFAQLAQAADDLARAVAKEDQQRKRPPRRGTAR